MNDRFRVARLLALIAEEEDGRMSYRMLDQITSQDFSATEFRDRRHRLAAMIGSDAVALLQGAPRRATPQPVFAQSKVFEYLCGIRVERSYLAIEGEGARTTLYVPDEGISNVKGGKLNEEARSELCDRMLIDEVRRVDELEAALQPISTLYTLLRPDEEARATKFGLMGTAMLRAADPFDGGRRRDELLVERLKSHSPKITIEDLDPVIGTMRLVKSPAELEILRKTGMMSAKVCVESMKATAPGVRQSVFHGIADYTFRLAGQCGHAYDFILEPSHPDSDVLLDGDLLLLDCAPDYQGYAMDIARIWPVNGVFDPWQRHTYGLILDYHKTLLSLARAGRLVQDIYDEADALMLKRYEGDEAGTTILNNMIERGVRYFNHHVGMSPHDAVDGGWRDRPLETGMVIAVDPMVWLDDAPHGYVRVEDTIAITPDGCEVLTGSAPFEIEEIEQLMKQPSAFPLELSL